MGNKPHSPHNASSSIIDCDPFPFTNDAWAVSQFSKLEALAHGLPDKPMAAVTIGAGGMPYLLHCLPSQFDKVITIDKHPLPLSAMIARVQTVKHEQHWQGFRRAMGRYATQQLGPNVSVTHGVPSVFEDEYRTFISYPKLAHEYASLQERVHATTFIGLQGHVPFCIDALKEILGQHTIGFLNITNASDYITDLAQCDDGTVVRIGDGYSAMARFIRQLGMPPEAIIAYRSRINKDLPVLVPPGNFIDFFAFQSADEHTA